ncbi:MAG TPA: tyrosine-type recombinase/integrase [Smithella sp.]|nr:tyrosine-type recombinase/integrase [Smithella sp.]
MLIDEAIILFKYYLQSNGKKKTIESYNVLFDKLSCFYACRSFEGFAPDEIFQFLEETTKNLSKTTRRLRYSQIKAFYNFIIERNSLSLSNPCNTPLLHKTFRIPKNSPRKILDREIIEEMIYDTKSHRDRLKVELQAKCWLRIGELLKLKVSDISDRTITLREPKSGKEAEKAHMPENISKKLLEYMQENKFQGEIEYSLYVIRQLDQLSKDLEPG